MKNEQCETLSCGHQWHASCLSQTPHSTKKGYRKCPICGLVPKEVREGDRVPEPNFTNEYCYRLKRICLTSRDVIPNKIMLRWLDDSENGYDAKKRLCGKQTKKRFGGKDVTSESENDDVPSSCLVEPVSEFDRVPDCTGMYDLAESEEFHSLRGLLPEMRNSKSKIKN